MTISREAVIWGFRFFLGRDPESEHVIAEHTSINDEMALARSLLASREYRTNKYFGELIDVTESQDSSFAYDGKTNKTSDINILIFGNCQVAGLASLIQAMTGNIIPKYISASSVVLKQLLSGNFDNAISESDLILMHPTHDLTRILCDRLPEAASKVRYIPRITFSAYHPDVDYVDISGRGRVHGPLGEYQSSIAFYGWKNGLSVAETIDLYADDVYEHLGFYNYLDSARNSLVAEGEFAGIPLGGLIDRWQKRGSWMYSMNHPKLFVLADIARAILLREGISILPNADDCVRDNLADYNIWPVYPEIARKLGVEGHYQFKMARQICPDDQPVLSLGLNEFVQLSFDSFGKYQRSELVCHRLDSARYQRFGEYLKTRGSKIVLYSLPPQVSAGMVINPYSNLADYQFWRRSIECSSIFNVDPVITSGFKINRADKIATAGSCFAQHISRTLQKLGFNYYVSEPGDPGLSDENNKVRNFGVFSARFGNIYTARQLIQLLDRAYGRFTPTDKFWVRNDGRYIDPFRPQVEPDGFASVEDLDADRAKHFSAVREMFENLDVFVFTLGLTESWRSCIDGAVFPLAPGVVAGEAMAGSYEFVNFEVADIVADMQSFIYRLLEINQKAKILVTVSPVPLIATYEDRHVLVSTTYSKSALRASAEEICRRNGMCQYFPSYEIITGNHTRGQYFENDFRSVTPAGVNNVMSLFIKHYSSETSSENTAPVVEDHDSFELELKRNNARINEIVCDEEALDSDR